MLPTLKYLRSLISSKPRCNVCKDLLASEVQASLPEIIAQSERGCLKCRLLEEIMGRFQVNNEETAWISLVAPTSYTSLYRMQSNVFGALELFTTESVFSQLINSILSYAEPLLTMGRSTMSLAQNCDSRSNFRRYGV
jgi:hypothetical protein